MPIRLVNRLKATSGVIDIVKASSHDFARRPILSPDDSLSSKSGNAFNESNMINTPIEAKSLENNTDRGNKPLDNSPNVFEQIGR